MRRRQGVRAAIVTLETALNNQLDSSTTPVGTTKMALVINTRQISYNFKNNNAVNICFLRT